MEHEVEGPRPRGRPKKTWKEVVREDCQARKLNKEDAMDPCKWRKMIKEARWCGWVWVGECSFWYRPTRVVPDQRPLNGRRCCCTYLLKQPDSLSLPHCPSRPSLRLEDCYKAYHMTRSSAVLAAMSPDNTSTLDLIRRCIYYRHSGLVLFCYKSCDKHETDCEKW